jgi:putative phosphoesterase
VRVLIISDSHGRADLLARIVEDVQPDHMIHCGDFCTPLDQVPDVSRSVVRGNCDWEEVADEQVWEKEGIRFFVVHGHRHQVKRDLSAVRARAEEMGAQVACFGHSHVPVCEQKGNLLLINPGSIAHPRGVSHPSYAVLETETPRRVRVSFFIPGGQPLHPWGGRFSL